VLPLLLLAEAVSSNPGRSARTRSRCRRAVRWYLRLAGDEAW